MLARLRLADAQLGMLSTAPVDHKHDLSRGIVDVDDDPLGPARARDVAWYASSRGEEDFILCLLVFEGKRSLAFVRLSNHISLGHQRSFDREWLDGKQDLTIGSAVDILPSYADCAGCYERLTGGVNETDDLDLLLQLLREIVLR